MKNKFMTIVIALIAVGIIAGIAIFISFIDNRPSENTLQSTEASNGISEMTPPPDETQAPAESVPTQALSRYVVVDSIGDGYFAGIDIFTSDGRLVKTCQYRYVVDRVTKQVFIYDEYEIGAIPSKEAFQLMPFTENGEYVYYKGDLPQ